MNNAVVSPAQAEPGMKSLMGLAATVPSTASAFTPGAAEAEPDVSIAGVMLLSAMSVMMAILGMVGFALTVLGCWWAISHVPVPAFVHHLLTSLHLARATYTSQP